MTSEGPMLMAVVLCYGGLVIRVGFGLTLESFKSCVTPSESSPCDIMFVSRGPAEQRRLGSQYCTAIDALSVIRKECWSRGEPSAGLNPYS